MISILLASIISLTGAEYIEAGEIKMNEGKWEEAIPLFKGALSSDLGPPANATCYWNLFIIYDHLNRPDDAADSVFLFRETVLFFKEFLDEAPVGHPGLIWVARAGIEEKLVYAKARLDIYWMGKNSYYCRSKMYSCSVPFTKMVGLYANKLPFCKGKGLAMVKVPSVPPNMIINATCLDGTREEYYFTVENEGISQSQRP